MVRSTALIVCLFSAALAQRVAAEENQGTTPIQTAEAFPELLPDEAAAAATPVEPLTLGLARKLAIEGGAFELPFLAQEEVDEADRRAIAQTGHIFPGPERVGLVRTIDPAGLSLADDWTWSETLEDGRSVWLLAIRSPQAYEIRLHLTDVALGDGSLVVYALTSEGCVTRGPFRGQGPGRSGDFWPASLPGDLAFVEFVGSQAPRVGIPEIVHCDQPSGGTETDGGGTRGGPLECNVDVMCHTVNTAARQAVGRMRYIRDGAFKSCTGTLLADLDPETFVPYFLTANHCVDETVDLSTLEVFWFFQTDVCDGVAPGLGDLPSNVNATLLATSGAFVGNDASVLRLHGGLPPGIGFAGWSSDNDDEELGVYGIHHPAGSWKRIVFGHYVSTSFDCGSDCGCFTPTNYAFYRDDFGVVEPGSSGSAMFMSTGQVIGQLYGSCSLCPDEFDCAHIGDYCMQYGEFAETYPDVAYWLRLGGTLWVNRANVTAPWNGLQTDPFLTVTQAHDAAWDGVQMKIVAGTYAESIVLDKQVTVRAISGLVRIGG